jgi:peptide/nickel transport system substrate-binding protein
VQAVIVIVVIVAAVVAGAYFTSQAPMGGGPTQTAGPTAGPTAAVQNPDAIIVETIGQPDLLDPAIDYEIRGGAVIQNAYEQLLFFKGDKADEVVPWLAQSYELSPDSLTYTFHLRSGIKFHDGTPFDANAVYYSLMRAMIIDDPDGPAWAMLQVLQGGMNYSKVYNNAGPSAPNGYGDKYTQAELNDFLNAKPIEVIDPMTVAIHLERPYVGWPFVMAYTVTAIVSPTAFKAHWTAPTDGTPYIDGATAGDYHNELNPWPSENMAGTGPYMLKSWDKATQIVTLVRNENYWGGPDNRGIAPVKNAIVKGINDPNTRILDMKAGACDLIGIPASITLVLPGGLVFQFADKDTWLSQHKLVSLNPDYQLFPKEGLWPFFNTQIIGFNQIIKGPDGKPRAFQPFADLRIRKAFTLAFNRTAFIHDVLQDFAVPASQMIPPGMFGHDPSIQPTPYDPATAKSLLLDAGANPIKPENAFSPKNPMTVEFSYILGYTADEAAATILASTINGFSSDTGLYASVVGLAGPQYMAERRAGRVSVQFAGWFVDYVDPDDFLVPFAHGTAGFYPKRMSYNNPKVNALIDEQARISDPNERLKVITQIQQMVNDDWPYMWLSHQASYSVSRSWLHERAGASVASGIERFNQGIYGYWFYEIEKGGSQSSASSQSLLPAFLAQVQLPAMRSFIMKRF